MVDPNIKKRMLAEGYEEDVIEYLEQEREDGLRRQFLEKNKILSRYYTYTSFYDFMGSVFPDLEKFMVITGDDKYREMTTDDLCEYQADKDNVYVVPASFINGCYNGRTCKDMYALVVDVDQIKPETLDIIIENGNLGLKIPMPSYIVNSGSGVHLYYVFREKVPYYWKNRKLLATMYRRLCAITKQRIAAKTDWHSIVQPFRMPGSLTKLGQVATAWECGQKWTVIALAKRLGIDQEEIDKLDLESRGLVSQEEYRERLAQRAAQQGKPLRKKRKYRLQDGNKGFYQYCLDRCYKDTEQGNRYMSMVGLSVVAYKVGVEKEQLASDLKELLWHYNQIGTTVSVKEMEKSMRAYNVKALSCTSQTLEEWFGWDFYRLQDKIREQKQRKDRKPRSREENVKVITAIRDALHPDGTWRNTDGRPTKRDQIAEYRREHPEAKPRDCIEDTGISKNTVYKWWKEVL